MWKFYISTPFITKQSFKIDLTDCPSITLYHLPSRPISKKVSETTGIQKVDNSLEVNGTKVQSLLTFDFLDQIYNFINENCLASKLCVFVDCKDNCLTYKALSLVVSKHPNLFNFFKYKFRYVNLSDVNFAFDLEKDFKKCSKTRKNVPDSTKVKNLLYTYDSLDLYADMKTMEEFLDSSSLVQLAKKGDGIGLTPAVAAKFSDAGITLENFRNFSIDDFISTCSDLGIKGRSFEKSLELFKNFLNFEIYRKTILQNRR